MATIPQARPLSVVANERRGYLNRPPSTTLLLALCGVALLGLALLILCVFGDVDISTAMPTAILISLTALPALAALTMRGYDLFSPFQLVAGYFFLYYAARSAHLELNPRALRLGLLDYDDYLPTAAWLAVLTFCAFSAGYALVRSTVPARHVLRACPRLPQRAPIIRLMLLAGFGVLAHVYILSYGVIVGRTYTQSGMRDMTENPIPGWLPPLSGLVEIVFCVATIYAMSSDVPLRDRRICKWFACICFVLTVFKTVSQGIREYVLLALGLWLLCHHYRRRRVGAGIVTLVLASGMLVFHTFQVLRGTLILRTPETLGDVSELIGSSIESFGSLSAEDFANLSVASVLDRSQGIDALSLVVKYTPERAPWGLGSSYISIPMQLFVPRALWADKPILKTHQDFERTYMGIHFYAQASQHVFADFYSNFAIFGLIAGALAFGMAFKSFYLVQLCSQGRKEVLLVYSYVILNAVHLLEADFVAGTVILVRAVIMVAFGLCFLSARRSSGLLRTGGTA
jgi:oligosaccharide repeat unit polymerase